MDMKKLYIINKNIPHYANCIIIYNEITNLYVGVSRKSDNTDFGLPGGKVEINETNEQSIIRELLEETSLKVDEDKLYFFCSKLLNPKKDITDNKRYCGIWFTFYKHTSHTFHTEESHIIKWCTKEELISSKTFGSFNEPILNDWYYQYLVALNTNTGFNKLCTDFKHIAINGN